MFIGMSIRDEWIRSGLDLLREEGIDAVRIDRLAGRVNRTKGSFHHHFAGANAYHQALLDRFEADALHQMHALVEETTGLPTAEALARIAVDFQYDPALEAAVRGWAGTNTAARDSIARVDAARQDALTAIWRAELDNPEAARIAALIPHLVIIGASVAQPTPSQPDMKLVFSLLSSLVPHVRPPMPVSNDVDPVQS